ncbi:MAG: hypothetical protein QXE67_02625 [Nitrososphaerota archaeon]
MVVKIVFLAHRVEFLEMFDEEVRNSSTVILEEPENNMLKNFLNNSLSIDEYLRVIDTNFLLYSKHQLELLKKWHREGKTIIQAEPYLETIAYINSAIIARRYDECLKNEAIRNVIELERKTVKALIEYQEALMEKDFDLIVEKVIEFAKMDAERFKVRDYMRAEKISKIVNDERVVVEAGYMHIMLPRYLRKLKIDTVEVNLLEKACRRIGMKFLEAPGDILTKAFIEEKNLGGLEKLLAAQSLIYISLLSKEEKAPTKWEPFPHLKEELQIIENISKMNYEKCRETFYKLWSKTQK